MYNMDTATTVFVGILLITYMILAWIAYHKVFHVVYFDLVRGLIKEGLISLFVGMVMAAFTIWLWWVALILVILIGGGLVIKFEHPAAKVTTAVLSIALAVALIVFGIRFGQAMKLEENGGRPANTAGQTTNRTGTKTESGGKRFTSPDGLFSCVIPEGFEQERDDPPTFVDDDGTMLVINSERGEITDFRSTADNLTAENVRDSFQDGYPDATIRDFSKSSYGSGVMIRYTMEATAQVKDIKMAQVIYVDSNRLVNFTLMQPYAYQADLDLLWSIAKTLE